MATEIGVPVGAYRVVSNNLHVYPEMPNYENIKKEALANTGGEGAFAPMDHTLFLGGNILVLSEECEVALTLALAGEDLPEVMNGGWVGQVGYPTIRSYLSGRGTPERAYWMDRIVDFGLRQTCEAWVAL